MSRHQGRESRAKQAQRATSPFAKMVSPWNRRYPGKGEAIMDLLGPFYGSKAELKPPLPELEQKIAQIEWLGRVNEVKFMHMKDVYTFNQGSPELLYFAQYGTWLQRTLGDDLTQKLRALTHVRIHNQMVQNPHDPLQVRFWDEFWDAYDYSAIKPRKVYVECNDSAPSNHMQNFGCILVESFDLILLNQEETVSKIRPFFDLWRSGNLIQGTDNEGALYLIVAD